MSIIFAIPFKSALVQIRIISGDRMFRLPRFTSSYSVNAKNRMDVVIDAYIPELRMATEHKDFSNILYGRKVKRHKRWWHLTNYTNILQIEEEMGKFFTVEITNDTIKEDVVHVLKDRGLRQLEIKNDRIEVTVSRLSEDQKDIIISGIRRIAKQTKSAIDHIAKDTDARLEKAIENQVVIPRKAYYIRRQLDATHKEYAGYIKFKEFEACYKISRWTFKIPTEEDQACYDDWLSRQKVAEQAVQNKSASEM